MIDSKTLEVAVVCVVSALIGAGITVCATSVRAEQPAPPACDPTKPLHERVRDAHWRWFEHERMGDCDADVMVEAAVALERCGGGEDE